MVSLVKDVIEGVLEEGGLANLSCEQELSLFEAKRADIVLVCQFGIPIGFIEVKKPGSSVMQNKRIYGQMFDYLTYVKSFAGRRHPFGILTTYNEWRLFWLPESDDIAMSDTIDRVLDAPLAPKFSHPIFNTPNVEMATRDMPRNVHGTTVIDPWQNDSLLSRMLLSCIQKMLHSPVEPMTLNLKSMPCDRPFIYVSKMEWRWEKFPARTSLIQMTSSLYPVVPSNFQNAFLLHDLGGGGDGRVWFSSTNDGKVCVLKFSKNKEMLEGERSVWFKTWPECGVKVKKLNNRWALVMPWIKSCSLDEFEQEDAQRAIQEAVTALARAGYKHDDLGVRHVGLFKRESLPVKAVLFDFARVSTVERSQADATVAEMMKELRDDYMKEAARKLEENVQKMHIED